MQRDIYGLLLNRKRKRKSTRKPLTLNMARQIGKTYILREFGKNEYVKLALFSLDRDHKVREVFEKGGS